MWTRIAFSRDDDDDDDSDVVVHFVNGRKQTRIILVNFLFCASLALAVTIAGASTAAGNSVHRLVGGIELPKQKYPFLGTLTFNRNLESVSQPTITCTVSLIAPLWAISAAHCLGKKSDLNVNNCIEGGTCSKTQFGDFQLSPNNEVKSYLRFGMGNFFDEMSDTRAFEIERIIRPKKAYPSGGYGDYGGIDVILIKLKEPVSADVRPICLPTADYKDASVKAIIAGYGKFRRAACQVGSKGPTKFRYCGMDMECRQKGDKFKNATCSVTFPYQGSPLHGCQTKLPSPSAAQPECKEFLKKADKEFIDWPAIDEFEIYDNKTLNRLASCFRTKDEEGFGWCGTNMVDDPAEPEFDIQPDHGWGFCSNECFPDMNEPFFGKAREKLIDVLDEDICENGLTENNTKSFTVKPEVLCVGYNHSYRIRVYLKDGEGNYHHVPSNNRRFDELVSKEQQWYIVGPGSCHGDSGGPLFQLAFKDGATVHIILGVTSSGTSNIGQCGGIDNPTHYTRLKKILPWIHQYISPEEMCLVGPEAQPAPF